MEIGVFGQDFQLALQGAGVVLRHERGCVMIRHPQMEEKTVLDYLQRATSATHKVAQVNLKK
jgi:hypothetical protein